MRKIRKYNALSSPALPQKQNGDSNTQHCSIAVFVFFLFVAKKKHLHRNVVETIKKKQKYEKGKKEQTPPSKEFAI